MASGERGRHISSVSLAVLISCLSASRHTRRPPPRQREVIRAECINLVFIYSPWISRGPSYRCSHVGTSSAPHVWQGALSVAALPVKSAGDPSVTSLLPVPGRSIRGGDSWLLIGPSLLDFHPVSSSLKARPILVVLKKNQTSQLCLVAVIR